MRVHVAHAQSEQMFLLDESQDLVIVRHDNPIQLLQKPQHDGARLQIADRQFADNEGMCRNLFSNEQISQYVIVPAQMVDPHRGVHQYHATFDRRRRTGFR